MISVHLFAQTVHSSTHIKNLDFHSEYSECTGQVSALLIDSSAAICSPRRVTNVTGGVKPVFAREIAASPHQGHHTVCSGAQSNSIPQFPWSACRGRHLVSAFIDTGVALAIGPRVSMKPLL